MINGLLFPFVVIPVVQPTKRLVSLTRGRAKTCRNELRRVMLEIKTGMCCKFEATAESENEMTSLMHDCIQCIINSMNLDKLWSDQLKSRSFC